ncbi:hypothetical protein FOMG_19951 [Fusarium oxysporum f. sp. melonis 26406]|uniref:Uncharacterized protein n=1 Tax=Fusarium oxysporum f. sp. melonis 26406 TaxID=1089452 RepID=W9YVQ7_FUSOX|nr:hypothetical protein FOMG_19951 [Fusarium oxysporum f. sp. melonis 26406]
MDILLALPLRISLSLRPLSRTTLRKAPTTSHTAWPLPDTRPAPVQPGRVHVTTNDELKRCVEIVELGDIEIPLADSPTSGVGRACLCTREPPNIGSEGSQLAYTEGDTFFSLVDGRMCRRRGCVTCNQKTLPSSLQPRGSDGQTGLPPRDSTSQETTGKISSTVCPTAVLSLKPFGGRIESEF